MPARDDLATLTAVVRLSRRARHLVRQNLVIAATVIAVLVTWDLAGDLPLPLGVAGHEGSMIWSRSTGCDCCAARSGDPPAADGTSAGV